MRVIGTAGHVDHGKSTLVKSLTGIDPDRLAEEKAREMTIDLGFAWLTLDNGETVGVVDVPCTDIFARGSSTVTVNGVLVTWNMQTSGNTNFTVNYDPFLTPPDKGSVLVE